VSASRPPTAPPPAGTAPAPDPTPVVPTRSAPPLPHDDRYRLGVAIGRGGGGTVHAATDQALARTVAYKLLRDPRDPTAAVRFQREAQITAQLEHPHIVPVHDFGVDARGAPFYTMKRISGRPLNQIGALGLSQVRRMQIFTQVCDAIAYAHSRGILHRDLKPANIMVGDFGEVVVLDWGLAKRFDEREATATRPDLPGGGDELTRDDVILGTPAWMSPEQVGGQPAQAASDQYALGAILYYLLTDEAPFPSGLSALPLVLGGTYVPARTRRPDLPAELDAICRTAMRREPAARYASVSALRDDVQAWLEGRDVSVHPISRAQQLYRSLRRQWRAVAAAGTVAAIAGVAMVVGGSLALRAHVDALTVREAETAKARRDARLQLAEREVTLATQHADAKRDPAARAALARAKAIYDEEGQPLPPSARFGRAWVSRRLPPPLLAWTLSQGRIERAIWSADGATLVLLQSDGRAWEVDALDGTTRATVALPSGATWGAACAEPSGGYRLTWLQPVPDAPEDRKQPWTGRWTGGGLAAAVPLWSPPLPAGTPFVPLCGADTVVLQDDAGVRAFDTATGEARSAPNTAGWFEAIATSGRRWAGRTRAAGPIETASTDFAVWDTDGGAQRYHSARPAEVQLDADGDHLIAAFDDHLAWIDLDRGTTVWTSPERGTLPQVRGDRLVLRAADEVLLLDTDTGAVTARISLPLPPDTYSVVSPTGDQLLLLGSEPALYPLTASLDSQYDAPAAPATAVRSSPDGALLAVAGGPESPDVRVLDRHTGRLLRRWQANPGTAGLPGTRVAGVSPDGGRVATADRDGHLRIWRLTDLALLHDHALDLGIALALDWTPTDLWVAFQNGAVLRFDADGAREQARLETPLQSTWDLATSPDGQWLIATARRTGEPAYAIWRTADGGLHRVATQARGPAYQIAWAPDSQSFAVATDEGQTWVDTPLGDHPHPLPFGRACNAVAYAPDGAALAVGCGNETLLWAPDGAAPFAALPPIDGTVAISDIAWGPDWLVFADLRGGLSRLRLDPPDLTPLPLGATESGRARDLQLADNRLLRRDFAGALALWDRWPDHAPADAVAAARLARGDAAGAAPPAGIAEPTWAIWTTPPPSTPPDRPR
jgi:WD40 repeat protein